MGVENCPNQRGSGQGTRASTKNVCLSCESYQRKVQDVEQTISTRKVLIEMLQNELQKKEDSYKNLIDDYEKLRFKHCSIVQELTTLKEIYKRVEEDNGKLTKEKRCSVECQDKIVETLRHELDIWREQYNDLQSKLTPPDVSTKINDIQNLLQNQNLTLKEVLTECLQEFEDFKSEENKVAKTAEEGTSCCICCSNEKDDEIQYLSSTLEGIKDENEKVQTILNDKRTLLAECICVLEKNHYDINNLSDNIESIIAEKDGYAEEIRSLKELMTQQRTEYEQVIHQLECKVCCSIDNKQLEKEIEKYKKLYEDTQKEISRVEERSRDCQCILEQKLKETEENSAILSDTLAIITEENKSNLEKAIKLTDDINEMKCKQSDCDMRMKQILGLQEELEKCKKNLEVRASLDFSNNTSQNIDPQNSITECICTGCQTEECEVFRSNRYPMENKNASLKEENKIHLETIKKLNYELFELREELKKCDCNRQREENERNVEKIKKLNYEIYEMREEFKKCDCNSKIQRAELEEVNRSSLEKIKKLNYEIYEAKEEFKRCECQLRKENAALQGDNESNLQKIERLNHEIYEMREEYKKCDCEVRERTITQLTNEINDMKEEFKKCDCEQKAAQQKENDANLWKIKKLNSEIFELRAEYERCRCEEKRQHASIQEGYLEKIEKLNNEINELKEELNECAEGRKKIAELEEQLEICTKKIDAVQNHALSNNNSGSIGSQSTKKERKTSTNLCNVPGCPKKYPKEKTGSRNSSKLNTLGTSKPTQRNASPKGGTEKVCDNSKCPKQRNYTVNQCLVYPVKIKSCSKLKPVTANLQNHLEQKSRSICSIKCLEAVGDTVELYDNKENCLSVDCPEKLWHNTGNIGSSENFEGSCNNESITRLSGYKYIEDKEDQLSAAIENRKRVMPMMVQNCFANSQLNQPPSSDSCGCTSQDHPWSENNADVKNSSKNIGVQESLEDDGNSMWKSELTNSQIQLGSQYKVLNKKYDDVGIKSVSHDTCSCISTQTAPEIAIDSNNSRTNSKFESLGGKLEFAKIHDLKSKIKTLEADLHSSSLELVEYEEENKFYSQKLESLMGELQILQEANLRTEEDNREYGSRMEALREECAGVVYEKDNIIKELKEEINVLKKLRDNMSKCYLENNDLRERLLRTEELLRKAKNEKDAISNQNMKLENQVRDLQENLTDTSDRMENDILKLHGKISMLEKQDKEKERQLDAAVEEVNVIRNSFAETMSAATSTFQSRNLEILNSQREADNFRSRSKIARLEDDIKKKVSVINSLELCVDRSNELLGECECEIQEINSQNAQLKEDVDSMKQNIDRIDENRSETVKLEQENRRLANNQQEIELKIIKLSGDYDELLKETKEKDKELDNLRNQYEVLKSKMRDEVEPSQDKCKCAGNMLCDPVKYKCPMCQDKVLELDEKMKENENNVRSLEGENCNLIAEICSLKNHLCCLQKNSGELKTEITFLLRKLAGKMRNLATQEKTYVTSAGPLVDRMLESSSAASSTSKCNCMKSRRYTNSEKPHPPNCNCMSVISSKYLDKKDVTGCSTIYKNDDRDYNSSLTSGMTHGEEDGEKDNGSISSNSDLCICLK